MTIAIKAENISKVYRLGVKSDAEENFAKVLLQIATSPYKNYLKYRSLYNFDDIDFNDISKPVDESILWALKNVSFEVKVGEVVGIIGTNGAGKSTLLKVLSRITPPSKGKIHIRGKVSSLLEVGTGFHPELSGRENVFLNGTILGMRKREVESKFDEIVDFSGVEKFLDTPVKRYSSGMRVRLAFAVAAHLEPEILIIDEVLAVGDAEFQKKCLNKMQDVGQEGRTVLFVSHNMPSVTRLCSRAILLNEGSVLQDGATEDIVRSYLHSSSGTSASREWADVKSAPGKDVARLRAVRINNNAGLISEKIDIGEKVSVEMEYEVLQDGYVLLPNFHFYNEDGIEAFPSVDIDPEWRNKKRPKGKYTSKVHIPGHLFAEGSYFVRAALITLSPTIAQFNESDVIAFNVVDDHKGKSARGDYVGSLSGVLRPMLEWTTDYNKS